MMLQSSSLPCRTRCRRGRSPLDDVDGGVIVLDESRRAGTTARPHEVRDAFHESGFRLDILADLFKRIPSPFASYFV